jgi:NAD(P)-dependent dehydrogenase (short-subunit alcohol dehydrogenase family)
MKLANKIAVITGGNSGIGLATAKRFVSEGAYVFITGRRQAELDKAVKEIGKNVTAIQGDISKLSDIARMFATVKQQKGQIDILFANAGLWEKMSIDTMTEEHFDKIFDINVKGTLFTVQHALPLFRDGGSIILNASVVSIKGMEAFSVYCATKAAVRSFARNWAVDLKKRGIRVNAVSPGLIPTPGFDATMNEQEVRQFVEQMTPVIPLGRAGTPDEIAKAVTFLASDDSSYITGAELFVDGGLGQI